MAVADLYRVRFKDLPGVVYAAGVQHAYNVARPSATPGCEGEEGWGRRQARAGAHPRRLRARRRGRARERAAARRGLELAARHRLHAPRADRVAPDHQQRVGRVTRRTPGKEAGIVVDFVHPATPNDDPVITLHSLLDRDVYRGGAIVVGPCAAAAAGLRVERRVVPVPPTRSAARRYSSASSGGWPWST